MGAHNGEAKKSFKRRRKRRATRKSWRDHEETSLAPSFSSFQTLKLFRSQLLEVIEKCSVEGEKATKHLHTGYRSTGARLWIIVALGSQADLLDHHHILAKSRKHTGTWSRLRVYHPDYSMCRWDNLSLFLSHTRDVTLSDTKTIRSARQFFLFGQADVNHVGPRRLTRNKSYTR